jgi:hypothetical protein
MHLQLWTGPMRAMIASTAVLSLFSLAACDGGSAAKAVPASNFMITVTASATETACPEDPIKVRFEPMKVADVPPGSFLEGKQFIEDIAMEGKPKQAADGSWVCSNTKKTRPVSPGTWNLTVGFDSGNMDCTREVAVGMPHAVEIVENVGCK